MLLYKGNQAPGRPLNNEGLIRIYKYLCFCIRETRRQVGQWKRCIVLAHSPSMVTLCIKGSSEMPFVFDMVGLHHFYHLTVSVDAISQSSMLWAVQVEDFPASIRHNEIRDLTAKVLTETCHNVGIEPPLQSINYEHFLQQILKMVHG